MARRTCAAAWASTTGSGIGCGSVGVSGMAEEVGSSPKELHAGLALQLACLLDETIQVRMRFREARPFRRDIAIMKTVVLHTELVEKLESSVHRRLGRF